MEKVSIIYLFIGLVLLVLATVYKAKRQYKQAKKKWENNNQGHNFISFWEWINN
jgi:hypothetical protein